MTIHKFSVRAVIAALALGMAGSASATVTYDFQGFNALGGAPYGSFVLTLPTFVAVNTATFVPEPSLTSCSVTFPANYTCGNMWFYNNVSLQTYITFKTAQTATQTNYQFAAGSFNAVGTYNSTNPGNGQMGRLIVSQSAAPSVPEPATWGMMLFGFGLIGGVLRQRGTALRIA